MRVILLFYKLSHILIGINPYKKEWHIIRIMSICVIIYILYYNSITYSIATALILPFSIDKITYLHEYKFESIIYVDPNYQCERFFLFKENEISDFLNELDIDSNYIANIEFIP